MASKEKNAIERAIEFGVDITLLKESLKFTPAERGGDASSFALRGTQQMQVCIPKSKI